jgi:hypothetical protein
MNSSPDACPLVTIPHWRPDAPVADDPGKFWGGLVGVGRKA